MTPNERDPKAGMLAYYNEHDPFAAAWLRELISDGHIAPGYVDERSIEDVLPSDLAGFRQCHFFAGIGVWSLALRRAGWPDDAPIWTGSCPCQPFNAAGKGGGFDDERHLWPAFHWLIEQCRPVIVAGEQVARKDGMAWLDLVFADLEATGYACGAVVIPACGFGAPHIRERTYWMADALRDGTFADAGDSDRKKGAAFGIDGRSPGTGASAWIRGDAGSVADSNVTRPQGRPAMPERADQCALGADSMAGGLDDAASARHERSISDAKGIARDEARVRVPDTRCPACGLAHTDGGHGLNGNIQRGEIDGHEPEDGGAVRCDHSGIGHNAGPELDWPRAVNGIWANADWISCTDGRWRAVEPGTFPLVDGRTLRNRVGLLRGAGNALTLG